MTLTDLCIATLFGALIVSTDVGAHPLAWL